VEELRPSAQFLVTSLDSVTSHCTTVTCSPVVTKSADYDRLLAFANCI